MAGCVSGRDDGAVWKQMLAGVETVLEIIAEQSKAIAILFSPHAVTEWMVSTPGESTTRGRPARRRLGLGGMS